MPTREPLARSPFAVGGRVTCHHRSQLHCGSDTSSRLTDVSPRARYLVTSSTVGRTDRQMFRLAVDCRQRRCDRRSSVRRHSTRWPFIPIHLVPYRGFAAENNRKAAAARPVSGRPVGRRRANSRARSRLPAARLLSDRLHPSSR